MNDIRKNLGTITSLEEGLLDRLLGRAAKAGSKSADDVRIEPRLIDEPSQITADPAKAGSKSADDVRIEPGLLDEPSQITADPAKVKEYIRQGMKPQRARLQALDDAAKAAKETPTPPPLGSGIDTKAGEYLPAWQRTKAPFSQYRERTLPDSDEVEKIYKYGLGTRAAGQALRAGDVGLRVAAKPLGFAIKHPVISGLGYLSGGAELERQRIIEPGATVKGVKDAATWLGNVGGAAIGAVAPGAIKGLATGLGSMSDALSKGKGPDTGEKPSSVREAETSTIDKLITEYKNFLDNI